MAHIEGRSAVDCTVSCAKEPLNWTSSATSSFCVLMVLTMVQKLDFECF
jgi:hypothetical protein